MKVMDRSITHHLRNLQTATAKGLMAGAFTITRSDGSVINGLEERDVSSMIQ